MGRGRCPLHCHDHGGCSRRRFLQKSAAVVAGSSVLAGCSSLQPRASLTPMKRCGPASQYKPRIRAAFVRRREDYGTWWPGAVYDGRAARALYTEKALAAAKTTGIELDLRPEPIYSADEADTWIAQAKALEADGLMLLLLDRQQHAWPTAHKAVDAGFPTVIFSPIGTSFTTNTIDLADRSGCVMYSTDDFGQAEYGLKMLAAGAKMKRTRCLVIKGDTRRRSQLADTGIALQYVPTQTFLTEYVGMPVTPQVSAMADYYIQTARRCTNASGQDVLNGARAYYAAKTIIEREQADAITMDCLGALHAAEESLPCLAWSRMNDEGIPAACEADLGAAAAHVIVQYLFERPGFQQDPVADTSHDAVIGAHCSCGTRLAGIDKEPEPFDIMHHHALRDATARPIWRTGRRVTCLDVLPGNATGSKKTQLLISTGTVMNMVEVPPAGGCVVSVRVKFDGDQPVLSFPGFHQLFFYGDFKRELVEFGRLFDFEAQVV